MTRAHVPRPTGLPAAAHGADAHDRPDQLPQAAIGAERDGGDHELQRLRHRGRLDHQQGLARPGFVSKTLLIIC